ncbi:MAG: thiosulfate oxidation carrier complex protein SoxZ [Burkholderiales bacterium]|nr:thiosulfate oxidation carrier complex protein SoxZ [Burkholderiales bacterium]
MADPMKLQARIVVSETTVRVLMAHEMETGQRKDSSGKPIPAWFIQNVVAQLNGRTVLNAYWGPSVSKNPFLMFKIKGAKAGDKVTVSWVDNHGDKRSDETVVATAA